ncbi:hypothetical protein ACFL6M_07340 [Candidatus Eisenbacteria bacterium]|uniref:Outer membrane protein beta-barrel domain-containing protein n=1 Tax=Eiseniibacteriota bacterium TaxID=2212470 RepID=A0ABV6YM34_UNCEI
MRSIRIVMLLTALYALIVLLAPPSLAGEPRQHDGGFFLRLSAGGGSATTSNDILGETLELSGGAVDLNFAIGAIVSPNLAIHGTLFGWMVEDPDVKLGSETATMPNANLDLSAIGAGLTYYLMPSNFYLSGSLGIGTLTIDTALGESSTDPGLAVDLTVGKEWWVSDRWGLGAAAALSFHSIGEEGIAENWTGTGFALRFSATLN